MSISGDNEVKTAVLEADPTSGGSSELTSDATENREIVGAEIHATNIPDGGSVEARSRAYLGTDDPDPSAGGALQNRKWTFRRTIASTHVNASDVFTKDGEGSEWYGSGSGIEWDEDETLSFDVNEQEAAGVDPQVQLVVYYREL